MEKISTLYKNSLLESADELGQVVVHCHCTPLDGDLMIRIWRSTFLFANDSDHVSNLVIAEKITLFPTWMLVKKNTLHTFTLIFTGLPRNCHSFDLIEDIPEGDGFVFHNLVRTQDDIYEVFI